MKICFASSRKRTGLQVWMRMKRLLRGIGRNGNSPRVVRM
jgi:hypothetical protein